MRHGWQEWAALFGVVQLVVWYLTWCYKAATVARRRLVMETGLKLFGAFCIAIIALALLVAAVGYAVKAPAPVYVQQQPAAPPPYSTQPYNQPTPATYPRQPIFDSTGAWMWDYDRREWVRNPNYHPQGSLGDKGSKETEAETQVEEK